jgi:hypothetical protein
MQARMHPSRVRGRVDQKRRSLLPVISAGSMHASSVHARGARCRYAAACAALQLQSHVLPCSGALGSLVEHGHGLIFILFYLA